MAKKEDKTQDKKKTAPKTSGKVKGPTGVGGKKKKNDDLKDKEPSKINQPARGRFSENQKEEAAEGSEGVKTSDTRRAKLPAKEKAKKLPKPKKALPKKTTASKDEKSSGEASEKKKLTKKLAKKPAKFQTRVYDEEQKRDYLDTEEEKTSKKPKKTSKTSKKKEKSPVSEKNNSEIEKIKKRKTTFSKNELEEKKAEEKEDEVLSTSELKDAAQKTAKKVADDIIPDEEMQEKLKKTAKSMLPDEETVKKTAKKLTKDLLPDPKKVKKTAEQVTPDEETKKTAKKATEAAKKTAKEKAKKAATDFSEIKKEENTTSPSKDEWSRFTEFDVHLFKEGKHFHLYKKLGSHPTEILGTEGVYFAVWAPNAEKVSVIGDFNSWDRVSHPMKARGDSSGIWEVFIPEAKKGSLYKYFIRSQNGYEAEKGDPYAFMWETPPHTASVVWDLENKWKDKSWMQQRKAQAEEPKPMSVYEMHLGSWRRVPEEGNRSLSYKELADQLPAYLKEMSFTHVEFMPVMEHPFFGSWGYQITGYFAPSSRFGTPQDFMNLIEALHNEGIGVILDWVPSHFPSDVHGLHYFDGTHLYEHEDPRKGFHPDWQSYIFNYGRNEVRSFLISNALFWLDKFHADGLRVDAVASMLYLDYSRKDGEWIPNEQGGNENIEAITFLKEFNEVVYDEFPDAVTIAEESTAWPMVSKPTYMGGLGFGQKWMMGWMHDTLEYFKNDPVHRKHHQNTITFSTTYAFSENFMLPLSHDEVVYGKQSILNKMPGDEWNKFANLRSLYAYMFAHPGTKLLFMGAEFAQNSEWGHDESLEWHLTHDLKHRQIQETLKALNNIYTSEPAFYEKAFEDAGFEWIDINDAENSVISFLRKGKNKEDNVLVVCNFTPVPRENYRIGAPEAGAWKEILNTDAEEFGGSNVINSELETENLATHGKDQSLSLTLPPMGVIFLKKK